MFVLNSSEHFGKTLSLLWLFAILNILFRDIHEMTIAGTISDILSGYVNGNPMSEGVLLAGAFAVELLLLAFLLTSLLVPHWSRILNLVLAPVAIFGIFYGAPADPDDYFFAFVEVCTLITVFMLAWRWKTAPKKSRMLGGRHAA